MSVDLGSSRTECVEALAASLPRRASLVSRLIQRFAARYANFDLSPASAGILVAVMDQPRRITELADLEGQTQPYVTKLVSDLEARGWAERIRGHEDGRMVWVHITAAGREAVLTVRRTLREMLTERLDALSNKDLAALAEANQALLLLIDTLQQEVSR
jgi:DNA-binding MarR family transcriptional regulator